jgi:hypothetical protein
MNDEKVTKYISPIIQTQDSRGPVRMTPARVSSPDVLERGRNTLPMTPVQMQNSPSAPAQGSTQTPASQTPLKKD